MVTPEQRAVAARCQAEGALECSGHARRVFEAGARGNDLGLEPGGRDQQARVLGAQALDELGRRSPELFQTATMKRSERHPRGARELRYIEPARGALACELERATERRVGIALAEQRFTELRLKARTTRIHDQPRRGG